MSPPLQAPDYKYITEECLREWKSQSAAAAFFRLPDPVPMARFLYELCWAMVRGDLPPQKCRVALDSVVFVEEARREESGSVLADIVAHLGQDAFDQQQQDSVDAASKALSYRQDIIEENIRLTYALQAAQQERSTFISSLLPLLSEYDNLQPSALDARSIVSNLKVLFEHLQEQLIITEEKLKESRYQITPWKTELSNNTNLPVQSPTNPLGKALVTSSKSSLDIVPQTSYPHIQSPMSSPVQARGDWGVLGSKNRQVIPSEVPARNADHDDMGRTSLSSR